MVLNNKPQMFTLAFPSNFFYQEVIDKWTPFLERMQLPYLTLVDFMNAQIQSFTFPSLSLETSTQQRGQYTITYPTGKELEPSIGKELTVTFKLTESYASYFIWWDQIDTYLHYAGPGLQDSGRIKKPCWMEPISLMFLTDAGFGLRGYTFYEITPRSMSELNLSYAAQAASYNTFSVGLAYNLFDIH